MQVAAPGRHAFVGQLRLKTIMCKSRCSGRVVTLAADDPRARDFLSIERLLQESDPHLSFEQHTLAGLENRCEALKPLESHRPLPGSAGLVAVSISCHDLSGRNANCVESKNSNFGMVRFDLESYGSLTGTGCTSQDDKFRIHTLILRMDPKKGLLNRLQSRFGAEQPVARHGSAG